MFKKAVLTLKIPKNLKSVESSARSHTIRRSSLIHSIIHILKWYLAKGVYDTFAVCPSHTLLFIYHNFFFLFVIAASAHTLTRLDLVTAAKEQ